MNFLSMAEVTKFAKKIGIDTEKLLGDWIVCIPGFTLQKYRQLQRSKLSIFSRQCFGGCISKMLGLPFRSPFVNLFLSYEDHIEFLKYPKNYMEKEPRFEKMTDISTESPNSYPLLSLGNIILKMLHYKEPEEAISKWNDRKKRINWYNLIVINSTISEEILEQFDALPYGKKFVLLLLSPIWIRLFTLIPK